MATLRYGRSTFHWEENKDEACHPVPILTFRPVWAEGRRWHPNLGDRTALLLLKRRMSKQVSFERAYRGWRASGSREEGELGEGRAFFRWLQRHQLGIAWQSTDIELHPYFSGPQAPQHHPHDEFAYGMSFAIAPVRIGPKTVKLYLCDDDVLRLLNLPYGLEEDFLELVTAYVEKRGGLSFHWH